MEELICKNCGPQEAYLIEENGPHKQAICMTCSSHLGFLKKPPTQDLILFNGKWKGSMIKDINDLPYLEWFVLDKTNFPAKYKEAAKMRISDIKEANK